MNDTENPCPKCGGIGRRVYPNTTTWAGGIGGQSITEDVCDACWGTGDSERRGADLRKIRNQMRAKDAEIERLRAENAACGKIIAKDAEALALFHECLSAAGKLCVAWQEAEERGRIEWLGRFPSLMADVMNARAEVERLGGPEAWVQK